jgi:type II secretory pathway pseudopilin PulG
MKKNLKQPCKKNGCRGFSLIEMMFAIGVLAMAIIGSLAMVVIGIGRNGSNRMDTTATNVAQTILEDISTAPPQNPPPPVPVVLSVTDCTGNALAITTSVGGAPLTANGDIDFSNPAPAGYQANYTMCSGTANGVRATYDVRWRIDPVNGSNFAKLVTVAARQPMAISKGNMNYMPPVTLRTIVGQ